MHASVRDAARLSAFHNAAGRRDVSTFRDMRGTKLEVAQFRYALCGLRLAHIEELTQKQGRDSNAGNEWTIFEQIVKRFVPIYDVCRKTVHGTRSRGELNVGAYSSLGGTLKELVRGLFCATHRIPVQFKT